jgi:hypothetical protein
MAAVKYRLRIAQGEWVFFIGLYLFRQRISTAAICIGGNEGEKL